jgi:hypothetical protein
MFVSNFSERRFSEFSVSCFEGLGNPTQWRHHATALGTPLRAAIAFDFPEASPLEGTARV